MPDPEISTLTPNVTPGGNLPQVSAASLGDTVGQAVEQGAEVANKIHRDAMAQFNQAAALDAHNKLQDFNQAALFDPKTGLLNQNTGKDAPAAVDKTLSDYDANVSKVASTLTNDQQREQFARLAQENRYQVQQHLNNYESRQINTYHEQVTQATTKNAATAAVQNVNGVLNSPDPKYQDPATRKVAISDAAHAQIEMGVAAIEDEAKRKNQDPAITTEQVAAYQSAAHYGVLQSLLSQGKDQDASAYYADHKDDLTGQEADTAARQVEAGSTAGDALRKTPSYVYGPDGQVRSRADVYAAIENDPALKADPKLYAAVNEQANRLLEHHQLATREANEKGFDDAYAAMKASPLGSADPAVAAQIAKLPPERQEWLRNADEKLNKLAAKQAAVPDNSDVAYALRRKATDPKGREEFIQEDLRQYRGDLSDKDYGELIKLQQEMRGQSVKSPEDNGIETATQVVSRTLATNGFPETDLVNGQPNTKALQFRRDVDRAVEANGGLKKLGTKGVQEICDNLMLQETTKVDRSWYNPMRWLGDASVDTKGPHRFESLPPNVAFSAAQLDQDTRARAVRSLQKQGVANPSDAEIYQTYLGSLTNAGSSR